MEEEANESGLETWIKHDRSVLYHTESVYYRLSIVIHVYLHHVKKGVRNLYK